jgi:hypothetical protein
VQFSNTKRQLPTGETATAGSITISQVRTGPPGQMLASLLKPVPPAAEWSGREEGCTKTGMGDADSTSTSSRPADQHFRSGTCHIVGLACR